LFSVLLRRFKSFLIFFNFFMLFIFLTFNMVHICYYSDTLHTIQVCFILHLPIIFSLYSWSI
jgi:hypothetical protein